MQSLPRLRTLLSRQAAIRRSVPFAQTSLSLRKFATAAPKATPIREFSDVFNNGTNAIYMEELYANWKKDPKAVPESWAQYFLGFENGSSVASPSAVPSPTTPSAAVSQDATESVRLAMLVRAYQVRGHLMAKLDPLGLTTGVLRNGILHPIPPELQLNTYGFTEADLEREFHIGDSIISGFLSSDRPKVTLLELVKRLQETYCGSIGVEYMHIQDRDECNWIRERIETPVQFKYTVDEKRRIFERLTWAADFEQFLAIKFPAAKRFGLEGCEALIPGMKALIDRGAELGVQDVVIGMPHRGRLNVLCNLVKKPYEALFQGFKNVPVDKSFYTGSGDVKYHLGFSNDRTARNGKKVHLSLVANPSHLEAVNPVVEGKAYAKQFYQKDTTKEKVLPILLHGDAAFAGQGIVYETFDLSGLKSFSTGGTVHIVVNNQVGFTTDPMASRGTVYCTEVAKSAGAPILHVNGMDPEAVVHAMELAISYRQAFHKDVVLDIICYRKHGHNEADEPRFTQPLMYQAIDKIKPVDVQYGERLVSEGVITSEHVDVVKQQVNHTLTEAFTKSDTYKPKASDWLESVWKGFKGPKEHAAAQNTSVSLDVLKTVGQALVKVPEHFRPLGRLNKIIKDKAQTLETGKGIDWGTGEALAFGSLLLEGHHVRLTGQDVERGTFSHRHAVWHDQDTNKTYQPLNNIAPGQAESVIANSSLSEFGVLGFELGYSLENPQSLVIWEAQFGDFVNCAQVIIDQFISSGEAKWRRQSGLVMLLPHGYDGQGPEHSSARLERFLQMVDSDPDVIPDMHIDTSKQHQECNLQVVNITTPANYFHALRRQIKRSFRKPLIVMSPKNLLRHRLAVSELTEFSTSGSTQRFQRVIGETSTSLVADKKIRRVVFCSGKVYYDLFEAREKRGVNDVAIVRVEQLAPFPFDHVAGQAGKSPNADVVWAQEEPKNMGAWNYIAPHIRSVLKDKRGPAFFPTYVGRATSASPATGYPLEHDAELKSLLDHALGA
eukprot:TRINITY_DN130_c0_g1_i1.p1 TRINITY_DN130_c0_g1~~TRINITY_DN130_c0_g1_i1.p1  ORF type:complete len:1005 (+),score=403.86 TRINITY_DN130_c0_g1_i1:51-3065(+)